MGLKYKGKVIIVYDYYIIKFLIYAYYRPFSPFLGHKILLYALQAFILQHRIIAVDNVEFKKYLYVLRYFACHFSLSTHLI
jgi:hypothetical protein